MTPPSTASVLGGWSAGRTAAAWRPASIAALVSALREPAFVLQHPESGARGLGSGGALVPAQPGAPGVLSVLAPTYPEWLGDRAFCAAHRVRYAYIAGEMANGIATVAMVRAMARARMLGFFGAAGLSFERVTAAVDELSRDPGPERTWGVNLIHSPAEPELEARVAAMLIERGVPIVSLSAFMGLTPAVVHCAAAGLHRDASGRIRRKRALFAKVSRPEVARQFMLPAPAEMLEALRAKGLLTDEEVQLARLVPIAEDLTVEADSGGHTDNRPLVALLPAMLALRDECAKLTDGAAPVRVGAAGGIGTPASAAAAFALGAAYVLTGSINQSAVESGLSDDGKLMLAQADLADVTMAPAADMFELGVRVQVLKRGTLFASRGSRLYELYQRYDSLEALPEATRAKLEREVLGTTVDAVWDDTQRFWSRRDPAELERALKDPRHKMALCFRWYLGRASRWAIDGEKARRTDFQVWCGPAMGAFNRWVKGSFLEAPAQRTVVQLALNILEGAAVLGRAQALRAQGVPVPGEGFEFRPRRLEAEGAAPQGA